MANNVRENSIRDILEVLRSSRALLSTKYIQWVANGPNGTHCAAGAVQDRMGYTPTCSFASVFRILNNAAKALYPEFRGVSAFRYMTPSQMALYCIAPDWPTDNFDSYPIVFINNHMGKEATLRVFDAAILDLEIQLGVDEPEKEEEEEPEEVPELAGGVL